MLTRAGSAACLSTGASGHSPRVDDPRRTIEFVDQLQGTVKLKQASELPRFMRVVSGRLVHRVVLSFRAEGPVVRFEDERGEVLMLVVCPGASS